MTNVFTPETFTPYFFGNFACIMADVTTQLGEFWKTDHPIEFWKAVILGCFYVRHRPDRTLTCPQIKPNYPGRCSHVCNAGFA